jgi:hypothetical protein
VSRPASLLRPAPVHRPRKAREGGAEFSPCGSYRFSLWRAWNPELPALAACGANPSTAGADEDDQTVTKLQGFAERWGFGSFLLVNPYQWIDTHQARLFSVPDPEGPDSDERIADAVAGREVLVGWGDVLRPLPRWTTRRVRLLDALASAQTLWCLGLTQSGEPHHPSRVGYDVERKKFL